MSCRCRQHTYMHGCCPDGKGQSRPLDIIQAGRSCRTHTKINLITIGLGVAVRCSFRPTFRDTEGDRGSPQGFCKESASAWAETKTATARLP